MLKILVLLNFILVVFNFAFIIKKYFISYRGSRKMYKNVIVIITLVICILISASCVIEGKRGIDIMKALDDPKGFNLYGEKLRIYQNDLGIISDRIPRNTVVAYVISALSYMLFVNIQIERKKETRKTGGWNYDKIRK